MEQFVEHGGVRVHWNANERIARFEVKDDTAYTGEAADRIIPTFASWVATTDRYGILVDASRVTRAGGEWRMRWARYHHEEGGKARIAIVQPNLFVRTVLEGYARITRTRMRAFPSSEAARAWLHAEVAA